MRVPTIMRGPGAASPWGQRRDSAEAIRVVPVEDPLVGTVIKGTLLTLLTLGIYRFWYRTNLRRYYWSNTTILGDGFDYSGTGRELLIGFLIMLAIFVPLNFAASLLGLFAGEQLGGVIASVIAFFLVPAFIQVAIYRGRAYRFSRTRYRGIRFHQSGSAWGFLATTAKWLLFTALSVGLLLPYLREAMHRYRTENTLFGSLRASCMSSGKSLMKSWLPFWFMAMFAFGVLVLIGATMALSGHPGIIGIASLLFFGAACTLPVLWQMYRVAEFRHFVETASFGELRLASDASARTVIWITVKFIAILVGALVGLVALVVLASGSGLSIDDLESAEAAIGSMRVGFFLLPLGMLLIYAVVSEIYLRRRLWAHFLGSITLTNTNQLAAIMQRAAEDGGAFGDSFDPDFDIAG
ncbi:Protein of unknown function DUF898 [Rhabdaerophilaceae bacterium]